ncbi:DUF1269 domain-containing protein [Nocardioides panacis]|uniref:DUF1269 domain-containing protein n=2 Tax=Nocardioides panacis TaxID=2849501 RepID=A0A975T2K1_9ACTN|nr:DUF1269 domain-containing protein [Nocardioides panacis]
MKGEALARLVDLVDAGTIRVLDLVFVRRELDGSTVMVEVADLDGDGELDLAVFEGASSGLIGDDDVDAAAAVIDPGSSAGILVYENTWAAPLVSAVRRAGGVLVAGGRIPVEDVLATLDDLEAAETSV